MAFCSSFLRKQESSAFALNDLEALDPSLRWDHEQSQNIPKRVSSKRSARTKRKQGRVAFE